MSEALNKIRSMYPSVGVSTLGGDDGLAEAYKRGKQKKRRRRQGPQQEQPPAWRTPEVAAGLFSKLQYGMGQPAEGMVRYGELPENVRKSVPLDGPPVGWDPSQLDARERMLLEYLRRQGGGGP